MGEERNGKSPTLHTKQSLLVIGNEMAQGKEKANEAPDITCASSGVTAAVYLTPLLKLSSGFP